MVAPGKKFYCNGEVTMWRYQATHATGFQAIVFRQVSGSTTQFQVIGVNDIPAGEINKPVSYIVPDGQRIRVERGDVIGWSFGDAAITLDVISGSAGDAGINLVRWVQGYPVQPSSTVVFFDVPVNSQLRKYSIDATVQVSINSSAFLMMKYISDQKTGYENNKH